ncbi:MAG: hypothetical protein AB7O55_01780 [Lautropia sp.]
MTDAAHVPCQDRAGGIRRFVWDLPHGRILIDVHPDGRVDVNGRAVAPATPPPAVAAVRRIG